MAEPGTMLVTILGAVRSPRVAEVAVGTPVGQIPELAGGASSPPRALLLGGYSGAWVTADEALRRPFSAEGLADLGAAPGAGLIAVLPASACGLKETARVIRDLARESAGQCGPCVFGLDSIAAQANGWPTAGPPIWPRCGAGSARWTAGARADIPVVRSGWSAVRCESSVPNWTSTRPAGAAARTVVLPVPSGRSR